MAVSYQNAGAIDYSSAAGSTVDPEYPASISAGNGLVLFVGMKPATANGGVINTPTDWTKLDEYVAGGFGETLGADTGNTRLAAFFKVATGSESGNLSVSLSDNNVAWAIILRYSNATGGWQVRAHHGSQDSGGAGSTIEVTYGFWEPADFYWSTDGAFAVAMCIHTDLITPAAFSGFTVDWDRGGVTGFFSNATTTEIAEPDSNVGNDIGGFVGTAVFDSVGSPSILCDGRGPDVSLTATISSARGPIIKVSLLEVVPAHVRVSFIEFDVGGAAPAQINRPFYQQKTNADDGDRGVPRLGQQLGYGWVKSHGEFAAPPAAEPMLSSAEYKFGTHQAAIAQRNQNAWVFHMPPQPVALDPRPVFIYATPDRLAFTGNLQPYLWHPFYVYTVNSDLTCQYSVTHRVSSDLVGQYALLNTVTSDLGATYAGNVLVSGDLAATYTLLGRVTSDLVGQYSVHQTITSDLGVTYAGNQSVSSDVGGTYAVLARITSDLFCEYGIEGAVHSDLECTYQVLQRVSSDLTGTYAVLARVTSDLGVLYSGNASISSDLGATFQVLARVSSDLGATYAGNQSTSGDLAGTYAVLARVTSDLGAQYVGNESVAGDLAATYSVLARVSSDLECEYAIEATATVTSDLECTYAVLHRVTSDLDCSYIVLAAATGDLTCTYEVHARVTSDLSCTFDVESYYAVPDGDVTDGGWLPSVPLADLYSMIDEAVADEADYIYTNTPSTCEMDLSDVTDPGGSVGHRLSIRMDSPNSQSIRVSLRDSSSPEFEIAAWTQALTPTPTTYDFDLSPAEIAAISSYNNLRLRLEAL